MVRRRATLLTVGILVVLSGCGGDDGGGSTPSVAGVATLRAHYIRLPTAHASPTGINLGPDGALWVTEETQNRIARVTTAGAVTESVLPRGEAPGLGIATGPDGALWFTDRGAGAVGRITTAGVLSRFPIGTGSMPLGICSGPLQSLWVTRYGTGEVDRVGPDGWWQESHSSVRTPHPQASRPALTGICGRPQSAPL
jgi:streptogramin lyase